MPASTEDLMDELQSVIEQLKVSVPGSDARDALERKRAMIKHRLNEANALLNENSSVLKG